MNINISKRNLCIVLVSVVICSLLYCTLFSFFLFKRFERLEESVNCFSNTRGDFPEENVPIPVQSYIMKEYNGKIGIYDAKNNELLKILDVYVATLPKADRKMLSEGISAKSEYELVMLVQDYTS